MSTVKSICPILLKLELCVALAWDTWSYNHLVTSVKQICHLSKNLLVSGIRHTTSLTYASRATFQKLTYFVHPELTNLSSDIILTIIYCMENVKRNVWLQTISFFYIKKILQPLHFFSMTSSPMFMYSFERLPMLVLL